MLWMISCAQADVRFPIWPAEYSAGIAGFGGEVVQLQAIAALDEKTISSVASVDWMGAKTKFSSVSAGG